MIRKGNGGSETLARHSELLALQWRKREKLKI